MTPTEFEQEAAFLAELEDWLRAKGDEQGLLLAIKAHANLQLMLECEVSPMPNEGNVICVRIGGYYTVVPLSDSTEVALAQIEGPDWQETGIRFARFQRAVDRSSQI